MAFLQTVIRVAVVWAAFFSAGKLVTSKTTVRKLLPSVPNELFGMLFFMSFSILLSLMGILNRTVVPLIILIFGIPGIFLLLHRVKTEYGDSKSIIEVLQAVLLAVVVTVVLTNASSPNLSFDDPLITYAVQPDKWLNSGRIFWIEETAFSGFPLTYEMTALWPASLSYDKIDQISLLQVFQMSLLFVTLFRGMRLAKIHRKWRIPLAVLTLQCSMLFYWCSLAKTDTLAILFSTLAIISALRENEVAGGYSSWLFMGLAMATKQTSVLILIPFSVISSIRFFKRMSMKQKLAAMGFLAAVPLAFAVRTMIHTGSPLYPVNQVSSMVKDEWRLLPEPDEFRIINDRSTDVHQQSDYSFLKHIGFYFIGMEGIALLFFAAAVIAAWRSGKNRLILSAILIYSSAAIWIFWPPWWGAKYSILIYPSIAILSLQMIQTRKGSAAIIAAAVISSFVLPDLLQNTRNSVYPADYRLNLTEAVLSGEWNSDKGYKYVASTPEALTYMWLNSAYSEKLQILSIHQEKRYFCEHQIYVGWRHPFTQPLYLDNSIEDECAILDSLGIDLVTFFRDDPGLWNLENRLEILNYIGYDNILEPLVSVSGGYLVCRYNSPFQQ